MHDKPAGDFDYDGERPPYSAHRRADPRIAAAVLEALAGSRTVVNVGAGAGSYEPVDRQVIAVEPSKMMRSLRPPDLSPAVDATAEALPFGDRAFDGATAVMTVHHWTDAANGLSELRRVTRGPVVILTFDPHALDQFWLTRYAPEVIEADRRRFPSPAWICSVLGGQSSIEAVPVPIDCTDGFGEAFYARPESFLVDEVRRSQSGWGFAGPEAEARIVEHLAADLANGEWTRRFGHLRDLPAFEGSLRLITAHPE